MVLNFNCQGEISEMIYDEKMEIFNKFYIKNM